MKQNLYKSRNNRVFSGVCGGLAEYFDVAPVLVRIVVFVTISFTNWLGLLTYIFLAMYLKPAPVSMNDFINPGPGNFTNQGNYTNQGNPYNNANPYSNPQGNNSFDERRFSNYDYDDDYDSDFEYETDSSNMNNEKDQHSTIFGIILVAIGTIFLINKFYPILGKLGDLALPFIFLAIGAFILYKEKGGKKAKNG